MINPELSIEEYFDSKEETLSDDDPSHHTNAG